MPKIVCFHKTGAADVLKLTDVPLAEPGKGEVRLKVEAIGLNRAEVMFRQGQYLEAPVFPSRLGYEAAGIIDAVGPGAGDIQIGDRCGPSFYGVQSANGQNCPDCRRNLQWPGDLDLFRKPRMFDFFAISGCCKYS